MTEQVFIETENADWQSFDLFPGTRFLSLAEPLPSGSIHRFSMPAGTEVSIHTHPCNEYVYVLSGTITTGEKECHAGTFWITPANTKQGPHKAITDVELLTIRMGAMGPFE
jgi:quercetin dioxygenase-like cupin family protein